ncbi:MAG: sialate O-acetylesterase [Kiritimatiellales bacterium]
MHFIIHLLLFMAISVAHSELEVPNVLSDGVVFQQNKPVKVWGKGTPGRTVTVTLSRENDAVVIDVKSALIDAGGQWQVLMSEQTASYTKYKIKIEDGRDVITIRDVLFGEVWLASGQSNMNLALKYIQNNQEIKSAVDAAGNEYIRGLNSTKGIVVRSTACSQTPLDDIPEARWGSAKNFTGVADLSGVGITFARRLFELLNQNGNEVPVAILSQTRGGTSIHAWLSYDATQASPALMEKYPGTWSGSGSAVSDFNQATACYNHLIGPLTNLCIAGIIWYQGENNVGNEAAGVYYRGAMAALIKSWRKDFASNEAAVLSVLLASHHYWPVLEAAAYIREAQYEALCFDINPGGTVIPIYDLSQTWYSDTFPSKAPIHPLTKQEVGTRLGNAAYATHYAGDIEYSGPVYTSIHPDGAGLEITFTHTSGGLKILEGKGETLRGFSICGTDRVFYPADAVIINSNTVKLSNPSVEAPVAATYAFSSLNYFANLANGAGLPAMPFRTDKTASVYNAPLLWMHCDTVTNWYNVKTNAYFTNTWSAGSGVTEISLTDHRCEGDAALRIDYNIRNLSTNRVIVSPVLEVGNLLFNKYPGLSLSLYKPVDETINVSLVFTGKDGVRRRLKGTAQPQSHMNGIVPVSGPGWHELWFSFESPYLDSDGVTQLAGISEVREIEIIFEIPSGALSENYIILDSIQFSN